MRARTVENVHGHGRHLCDSTAFLLDQELITYRYSYCSSCCCSCWSDLFKKS